MLCTQGQQNKLKKKNNKKKVNFTSLAITPRVHIQSNDAAKIFLLQLYVDMCIRIKNALYTPHKHQNSNNICYAKSTFLGEKALSVFHEDF